LAADPLRTIAPSLLDRLAADREKSRKDKAAKRASRSAKANADLQKDKNSKIIRDAFMTGHVPDVVRRQDPDDRAKVLAPVVNAAPTIARTTRSNKSTAALPKTPHPLASEIPNAALSEVKAEVVPKVEATITPNPVYPRAHPFQTPQSESPLLGVSYKPKNPTVSYPDKTPRLKYRILGYRSSVFA
jgi:hypothetical protein